MEAASYQDLDRFEQTHWWFRGRRAIITSFLATAVPPGARRALDIGCGTGLNAALLARFAGDVTGVDSSDDAIRLARARMPGLALRKASFPEDDFDGSYDVVTLFDVLEHLRGDGTALAKVETMLAPGGVAVLTVPALPLLWTEHDELAHHQRRYTRQGLSDLIRAHTRLQIVRLSYFNTCLFLPILAFRLLRKAFGLRAGASDFFAVPPAANRALTAIFAAEAHLLRLVDAPIGVSLIAVLRKPPIEPRATA